MPFTTYQIGKSTSMMVNEPAIESDIPIDVIIKMAAGKLELSGGAKNLIEGSIEYNVPDLKPTISRNEDIVSIIQDISLDSPGIPVGNIVNKWNLQLGNYEMNLVIDAGAYDGIIDLSGVPLSSLSVSDGASSSKISFNKANPIVMEYLNYRTGASNIQLYGLSNANFKEMKFDGGAGAYTLDFSGELKQDCTVNISSGVSNLKIIIPENTSSNILLTGGVNNIYLSGTWTVEDRQYWTDGDGPNLNISVDMAVGSLELVAN